MSDGYFGFKDPRTMRLMPVWHQIFNELKLVPKIVLCLRNPAQAARSLNARDGLDPEIGEYRWLVHMIDFFRYINKFDFFLVEYEEWFKDPSTNIKKLQKFLDLPWEQSEADLDLVLSGIIDPAARHDDSDHREASQPLVRTLYKLASRASEDGVRDQIAYIVSQVVSFQQLQRPFFQVLEDVARTAAKFPEIEQEATALRAALGERDAAVEAVNARAVAVEGRLAEALAEIEAQRGQIAALASQRDAIIETAEHRASGAEARLADAVAEIEAQRGEIAGLAGEREARAEFEREANGLRATLAEREQALAELSRRGDELLAAQQASRTELAAREAALQGAEQRAQERAAAADAMQSEIAALQEAVAKAEARTQERAASTEAMQTEMAALRGGLARTEREAQDRAAAGAALQSEIGGLRATLAKAEREAQERAANMAAMQAEIGALQETLTAARQVGKAAVAAFRIETAAPTKPDRPGGWRQGILRFLGASTSF
jgi:hypothetical protein